MPESSNEPEKYTIDEMMDRLKGRDSSESSEMVTRSDGSQAMRVKKRKRRTNQAVNEETKRNHRVQVAQIAGFVILVVLLCLAAGIGVLYANSSSFRNSLLAKMDSASGGKVSVTQFRMNPANANADSAVVDWPEGNALANLSVKAVTAKIAPSSFLGKTFSGEEMVAAKGTLLLRAPIAQKALLRNSQSTDALPVRFQRYSVPSLDILFGNETGTRRFLKGTEASFFPSTVSGVAELRLRGGLLEFDAWPVAVLDRSYVKMRKGAFQVQSMRFTVPKAANDRRVDKGFIDFSGTIRPLESGTSHTLEAHVEQMRLPYLAGADLGRFFLGSVDSVDIPDSNFMSFSPASPETSELELTLTNSLDSRIDLGGFKFLSQLSVALDDRWYEFPNFADTATMVLKRRGGDVDISEINLVSRGRMAVRGSISNAKAGGISGTLRIGIPETTVAASPNKRLQLLFGEVREGYRWLDLKIGGTSAVPADDFKDLYSKAAETPQEESVAPSSGPDEFDGLIEGGQ